MKHPGVTSLITKTTFLTIVIVLAGLGIHTKHPFLLHCIQETSPLFDANDTSITYCDFNETDTTWANCVPTNKDRNLTEKLAKLAATLDHLEFAITIHGGATEWMNKSKVQVEKELSELQQNGTGRLVQKVRICGENENVYRIVMLIVLVLLIISAALATVHLHRIADYKVGFHFSWSFSQYLHS